MFLKNYFDFGFSIWQYFLSFKLQFFFKDPKEGRDSSLFPKLPPTPINLSDMFIIPGGPRGPTGPT